VDITLQSDSSPWGWGGCIKGSSDAVSEIRNLSSDNHIKYMELLSSFTVLNHSCVNVTNKHVRSESDKILWICIYEF